MEFLEIREDLLDVIGKIGSERVTRELRDLPGSQAGKNRLGERTALLLQFGDLVPDVDLVVVAHEAKFIDLRFKFCDRLFEIEEVEIHAAGIYRKPLWQGRRGVWSRAALQEELRARRERSSASPAGRLPRR